VVKSGILFLFLLLHVFCSVYIVSAKEIEAFAQIIVNGESRGSFLLTVSRDYSKICLNDDVIDELGLNTLFRTNETDTIHYCLDEYSEYVKYNFDINRAELNLFIDAKFFETNSYNYGIQSPPPHGLVKITI
jgi:outer membrane usher protein FimD/PapC